jgi:coenzyme PQQ precursor peptide PqqA
LNTQSEDKKMAWKTPKIVEIALGAEINCYACAELS